MGRRRVQQYGDVSDTSKIAVVVFFGTVHDTIYIYKRGNTFMFATKSNV